MKGGTARVWQAQQREPYNGSLGAEPLLDPEAEPLVIGHDWQVP